MGSCWVNICRMQQKNLGLHLHMVSMQPPCSNRLNPRLCLDLDAMSLSELHLDQEKNAHQHMHMFFWNVIKLVKLVHVLFFFYILARSKINTYPPTISNWLPKSYRHFFCLQKINRANALAWLLLSWDFPAPIHRIQITLVKLPEISGYSPMEVVHIEGNEMGCNENP